jgi:hypothetical protein
MILSLPPRPEMMSADPVPISVLLRLLPMMVAIFLPRLSQQV